MVTGPKTGSWGTYSPNSEIVGNFNETSTKGTLENGGMGQVILGPRPRPEVRQQVPWLSALKLVLLSLESRGLENWCSSKQLN